MSGLAESIRGTLKIAEDRLKTTEDWRGSELQALSLVMRRLEEAGMWERRRGEIRSGGYEQSGVVS